MRAVGIKVLKNRLSEYVRAAANGETVLITDRDRVVAEIRPPGPREAPLWADVRLAELVRRGLVRPPLVVSREAPPRLPVDGFERTMKMLDLDREDR